MKTIIIMVYVHTHGIVIALTGSEEKRKEGRKEGTGGYLLQLLLHCPVDEHLFYDLDDKVDDDTHE